MAVGDLISNAYTTTTTFQPASGVQICITQFIATATTGSTRIRGQGDIATGTLSLQIARFDAQSGSDYGSQWSGQSHKFFIDNSSYLEFLVTGAEFMGFSGIQIK
jgi:hypothetical protein